LTGKRRKFFGLGLQGRFGKLESGELQIVGQQAGIGMRQTFQHHDGGRSAKVDHTFSEGVPAPGGK